MNELFQVCGKDGRAGPAAENRETKIFKLICGA
jgi:hypothetical protein